MIDQDLATSLALKIKEEEQCDILKDRYVGPFRERSGEYYLTKSFYESFSESFTISIDSFFGKKVFIVAGVGDLESAAEVYNEITSSTRKQVELLFIYNDNNGIIEILKFDTRTDN
jgi:hypothetical protein